MAGRGEEKPTVEILDEFGRKGAKRETHPAFAVAVVSRRSGTPRTLFQSDLRHNETITLSIELADRTRDLNHDWVHPGKKLVEIEMSLAQWGSLVSSIGLGSGVPVTLRRRETEQDIPGITYEPRIAENVRETRGVVGRLMENIRSKFADVEDAFESKKGVKAMREAIRSLGITIGNTEDNAAFAVKSLAGQAESVVAQARSDIESHILSAAMITGLQSPVLSPELGGSLFEQQPMELTATAADDESAAHSAPAHRRCICDGAAYEAREHPFLVNPDCPVHAG